MSEGDMTESGTDSTIPWSVPQCPFTIETSARVLDDIRLAVTDAFFSLPRGGAEIGGILLGAFQGAKLVISDYAALDCEHAYGPSFTLSPPDEARLVQLLAAHDGCAGGLRAVGWYHSHTRSEIFLSDADLAIHERFFPERWQVALVMKPHTFQPARIGYFFREAEGTIHATASYREELLEPLPIRQVPGGVPAAPESVEAQPRNPRPAPMFAPVVDIAPEVALAAAAAGPQPAAVDPIAHVAREIVEPPGPLTDLPLPKFAVESASSARKWLSAGIAIVAVLGVGAAGAKTSDLWLPRVMAAIRPAKTVAAPAAPVTLGLTTLDRDGQLQITWDRNSAALRNAADGVLEINEGSAVPTAIQLDAANLQTGSFNYARTADKVDIRLVVHQKSGPDLRESASFLGKLPEHKGKEETEAAKQREADALRQRDEMAKQTARMKADLNFQAAKTKKLEKDMQAIREEMRLQQQRRLAKQAPDK